MHKLKRKICNHLCSDSSKTASSFEANASSYENLSGQTALQPGIITAWSLATLSVPFAKGPSPGSKSDPAMIDVQWPSTALLIDPCSCCIFRFAYVFIANIHLDTWACWWKLALSVTSSGSYHVCGRKTETAVNLLCWNQRNRQI